MNVKLNFNLKSAVDTVSGSGGAGQREPGQVQEDGSWAGRRRRASRHRRVCAHQDQDQEPRQLRQGLLLSECVSWAASRYPYVCVTVTICSSVSPAGLQHSLSRAGEVARVSGVRGQRWEGHGWRRVRQLSHSHVLELHQETDDRLDLSNFNPASCFLNT